MPKFLRLPAVRSRTGLSRSSIYLRITRGEFPAPVKLGVRASGWIEEEVDAWIAKRILATRGGVK
ncbi:MAG: AlpA family transcriptional regulator [Burkholderiales bacterium]